MTEHTAPLVFQRFAKHDFVADFYVESPADTARALHQAASAGLAEADSYGEGGAVSALEAQMATLLGKEDAVVIPSGTLANHLALRALVRDRNATVLAQGDSHLARDCGDAPARLSGIHVESVMDRRAGIAAQQIHDADQRARDGKVPGRLAVVAMESPVRRRFGEAIDPARVAEAVHAAREAGALLHLDGARLLFEAAARGCTPAFLADPFDTVYVSLWKSFGCAGGAVLAGSRDVLSGVRDDRRRLGGSPASQWMIAALARARCEGIVERMRTVFTEADTLRQAFAEYGLAVKNIPGGTHIVLLHVAADSAVDFAQRMRGARVRLPAYEPALGGFPLRLNRGILAVAHHRRTRPE